MVSSLKVSLILKFNKKEIRIKNRELYSTDWRWDKRNARADKSGAKNITGTVEFTYFSVRLVKLDDSKSYVDFFVLVHMKNNK